MLVLSRKELEEIVIDGRIRLQIIELQGNRVKLGFVAPAEVLIQRQEIAGGSFARIAARPELECASS